MQTEQGRAIVLAGALTLAACAPMSSPPASAPPEVTLAGLAMTGAEVFAPWLVGLAEANPDLTRAIGLVQLRPGRLQRHPEAMSILEDTLRPLDILVFHSENRMSGLLLPGHFTHGAIYLGTEAQLSEAGLWNDPFLDPHRTAVRAGAIFLEAVDGGVQLHPAETVLDTDAVAILRPQRQDRATALRRAMGQVGVPFDMAFDASDGARLFCVELIALSYPALDPPRDILYGRETILVDRLVTGALTGDLPLTFAGYLEASPGGGLRALSAADLAFRLRAAWPG
jgi:hypothetical protein